MSFLHLPNRSGRTYLHVAADPPTVRLLPGHLECLRLLVDGYACDMSVCDHAKKNPINALQSRINAMRRVKGERTLDKAATLLVVRKMGEDVRKELEAETLALERQSQVFADKFSPAATAPTPKTSVRRRSGRMSRRRWSTEDGEEKAGDPEVPSTPDQSQSLAKLDSTSSNATAAHGATDSEIAKLLGSPAYRTSSGGLDFESTLRSAKELTLNVSRCGLW